jgi:hypothetical protein
MHASSQSGSGKGLGIDVPQPPRGARQQPSYSPLPTQSFVQQELTHHQSQPQLHQVYPLSNKVDN